MPTKGKLISDYTSREWESTRQRILKPGPVYWITILSFAFFLLLSGFGRILLEEYHLEAILRIAAGIVLVILLMAYAIRKTNKRTHK